MGDYEKEQERLMNLMQQALTESDIDFDEGPDDMPSESDDDMLDNDSETEQDISDQEEVNEEEGFSNVFVAKDGITWEKMVPSKNVRTRAENMVTRLPISKLPTTTLKKPLEIWQFFINDEMLDTIVMNTNRFIIAIKENYSRDRDARETNKAEIQALFGLLYYAGVLKGNRLNTKDLWATNGSGVEMFRLAMSLNRFRFLLAALRFDDKATRSQRKETDKLAPIREYFIVYSISEYVTIDEKLEAFRGRCSFRQYIPSKPNKYGIKIFALSDARMYYTANLEVYVGKQPPGPFQQSNSPGDVVMRLCEPIYNSGRNVTLDNWFTSLDLVNQLLKKKITVVGTIRKNKRELPVDFSNPVTRPPNTSMFAFRKECTLVSHIPKKKKNVLLLSSVHHDDAIDDRTGKPEIIMLYNSTKGGVDTVDQLCSNYNCARNTQRWPLVVFYSSLNVAGINSYVIYCSNNPYVKIRRREFLKQLSMEMVRPHLLVRSSLQQISRPMKLRIQEICDVRDAQGENPQPLPDKGRCYYCNSQRNRKTRYHCKLCKKFMCLEHVTIVCETCFEKFSD